jgi:hypothetical protein
MLRKTHIHHGVEVILTHEFAGKLCNFLNAGFLLVVLSFSTQEMKKRKLSIGSQTTLKLGERG